MSAIRNKLLVLNAGSSSLKYKLFQLGENSALKAVASGVCERIGDAAASFHRGKAGGGEQRQEAPLPNHTAALELVSKFLGDSFKGDFTQEVFGVGHRVVHGREISEPVLITDAVRATIEKAADLAPLHNPPNLMGIDAAKATFASAPHVAVFDTAFHQTMPPEAFMYALPYELYTERAIRRYGFHGTSYKYLTQQAARMLGKPESETNLVICHLGAGSSMCAVKNGKSVDTTMGLTPLEGLMMGTRCGDIDPAIIPYLASHGMGMKEVDTLLNKKSGFLGLAGNADLRNHLEARFGPGSATADERSKLAVDVYVRRVRKYLGAYFMHLEGQVDAIVFSAGIGENSAPMRREFVRGMEFAGVVMDDGKNDAASGTQADVSAAGSRVKLLVIPTDEELSIAQQTLQVIRKEKGTAAAA